jgi:hypothetical protein
MENQKEIWKTIDGYEGLYEISNLGRVKSLSRIIQRDGIFGNKKIKERIIKPSITNGGYYRLNLINNKIKTSFSIHRLLALYFLPNIYNKPQVNHINGIKTDNRIENLEWCTAKENINHAFKIGLIIAKNGINHNKCKLNTFEVLEIRENKNNTLKEISKKYNISISVISKIKHNKLWKHI